MGGVLRMETILANIVLFRTQLTCVWISLIIFLIFKHYFLGNFSIEGERE